MKSAYRKPGPLRKGGGPRIQVDRIDHVHIEVRDRNATIAFRGPGSAFRTFVESLPHADIVGRDGTRLTAADCVDHGLSHSVYFTDPDGNRIELTTYDLG